MIIQKKLVTLLLAMTLILGQKAIAQNPINWTPEQLMNPAQLSAILKDNKNIPVILCIGPGAIIPQSKDIGMVKDAENLKSYKDALAKLPKDTQIVIYCGCCPYEHCPNVRPAVQLLNEMKFNNQKLLNLHHHIKADWTDKGFPVTK